MDRKFKVEAVGDSFVEVAWKFKNTVDIHFVWSKIKHMPVLNDSNKPIGILNDFKLDTSNGIFEVILIFTVWNRYMCNSFEDIEIVPLGDGKFDFKMK